MTKAGIVAAGAALVTQAAQAAFTANDLYLGLTLPTATSDYIIDLGQASGITGSTSVVNLSSDFSLSTYNSIFSSASATNSVSMGVVGGNGTFGSVDLFTTILGSTSSTVTSGYSSSSSTLSTAANRISTMSPDLPSAGNGVAEPNKDWANDISPAFTASTFYGASGINPNSAIGGTGIITEALWGATPGGAYNYLGSFTLNASGGSPSLTYTPSAVPEPNAASVLGIGGILFWMLRWRTNRSNV
jgi:hypothetical protein